jgi:glycosyltransferase involved in cell wall biosynthesis
LYFATALMAQQKITLTIITPTLLCGGAENQVQLLCNNINTQQFTTQLLVINNSNAFFTIGNNVAVTNLNKPGALAAITSILKIVRQQKPNIVFSTANHVSLLLCIFKFLLPKNTKLVCREGSLVSQNIQHAKWPWLYKWVLKIFYKNANAIVCLYQGMATDLQTNFNCVASQLPIIPSGVQIQGAIKNAVSVPPVFITVARLIAIKQIHKIIEALSLLTINYTYYIIGEGPEFANLEAVIKTHQLQQKIILVGAIPQPFKNYTNATAYLYHSVYEGLPNSVIEALAHGIPVVAQNIHGSIGQLITNGQNGFLVTTNTPQAYANAITTCVNHTFNHAQIAQQTQGQYGVANYVQQTQALFTQMASNN